MTRPYVVIGRRLPEEFIAPLQEKCQVDMPDEDRMFSREELIERLGKADAVLVVLNTVDEEICAAASPRCKIFANYGVGYNQIDVGAATRHGIWVSNTPDVVTEATADMTWALILAVARRVTECDRLIRADGWKSWGPLFMLGASVSGKTIGIIGGGRIGLAVAERASGFNMSILYTANSPKPDFEARTGGKFVDMDILLKEADFVSLHVPLSAATRHLIGARELGLMKQTAVLINTARGPVIDEKALVAALSAGKISGAGLDVFEKEPQVDPGLLTMDNVVLTPHSGGATFDTRLNMGIMCVENILAALQGELPPNCLNPMARNVKAKE